MAEETPNPTDQGSTPNPAATEEPPPVDLEQAPAIAGEAGPADMSGGLTSEGITPDNLDLILDVNVTVSLEVGRTSIPIRRLLQLRQGAVLELDQLAGQPMDVLVNGTLIAHGEVVLVNDRVGIRLLDVVSPRERMRTLN